MNSRRVKPADDTKERLIYAAEKQFAIDGARARVIDIVSSAGCGNAAAINYHFHSREGLLTVCRAYRERPIDLFRARLYQALCEEVGEDAFSLGYYYFILIAPSVAVVGQLLPNSYYARFVANCKTYSLRGLQERQSQAWAKTAIHCMHQVYTALLESLSPDLLALRVTLYEHHGAQGLAQMEAMLMQRLDAGEALAQVQADIPAMAVELASHILYLVLQDKVPSAVDFSVPVRVFAKLLHSGPPFQFSLPE